MIIFHNYLLEYLPEIRHTLKQLYSILYARMFYMGEAGCSLTTRIIEDRYYSFSSRSFFQLLLKSTCLESFFLLEKSSNTFLHRGTTTEFPLNENAHCAFVCNQKLKFKISTLVHAWLHSFNHDELDTFDSVELHV